MAKTTPKFERRRVIAVDVDETLIVRGSVNGILVSRLRTLRADGYQLILWSARGEAYSKNVAAACGVADLFDHIISKPGYLVDDQGWAWTRYTQVLPVFSDATELETPVAGLGFPTDTELALRDLET